jgi:hypothetical protein
MTADGGDSGRAGVGGEAFYRLPAADVQTACTEAMQMKDALTRAMT